jgi:hypothetical protein
MTQEQILAQTNITKTEKIKQLLGIGLTRSQVAEAMGIGYGFVQNVYAKHFGTQRQNRPQHIDFSLMPFTRRFGVEIEAFVKRGKTKEALRDLIRNKGLNCELNDYNHTTRNYWKIVTDGSLRAEGVTFEIVSPILEGEDGLEQLEKVCQALKEYGCRINKTCGLHIHFDASTFSLQTWKNLLINYAKLEDTIDAFMPHSRRGNANTYCKSLKDDVNKVKEASSLEQIATRIGTRYKKINTQAYARHKTIEFRQHSGTIEFMKIKNWILFLHNLVEASKIKILTNTSLESLAEFNQEDIITFYAERTEELN